jgi:sigma-B regulation protein RsbU (phosphoserine phosphatase)
VSREVDRTARVYLKRPREAPDALLPYLVVKQGANSGEAYAVPEERTILGRGPSAGIRLDDAGVSGIHADVWSAGRTVWIKDLGSSNGTFLDDRRITEATAVPVGSVILVGRTLLRHESRSAQDVDRERELDADLERASGYVEAILPAPITDGPLRVDSRFIPSTELGGDAFGYHWLDDDRFALFLIDVSGHGAQASLHSVSAINALRHRHLAEVDFARPEEVLAAFNESFQMSSHNGLFFTAWYGVFDRRDRRLAFSSAGHPPPLVLGPEGGEPERLTLRNPPIGMAPGLVYKTGERTLAAGTRLYLFSDGVFEVQTADGAEWGYEELVAVVGRPSIPHFSECARIEVDVRAAMAAEAFDDDFSLVVAEFGDFAADGDR